MFSFKFRPRLIHRSLRAAQPGPCTKALLHGEVACWWALGKLDWVPGSLGSTQHAGNPSRCCTQPADSCCREKDQAPPTAQGLPSPAAARHPSFSGGRRQWGWCVRCWKPKHAHERAGMLAGCGKVGSGPWGLGQHTACWKSAEPALRSTVTVEGRTGSPPQLRASPVWRQLAPSHSGSGQALLKAG